MILFGSFRLPVNTQHLNIESSIQWLDCIANEAGCVEKLGTAEEQILHSTHHSWPCMDRRHASTKRMPNCGLCQVCKRELETTTHISFLCHYTTCIWTKIKTWMGLANVDIAEWEILNTVKDWCTTWLVSMALWGRACIPRHFGFLGDLECAECESV